MRFKDCLLISDIDGTLMEQGYINPKNLTHAIVYNDCSLSKRQKAFRQTNCSNPEGIKELVDFVGCACRDRAVADFIEYLNKADF